MMSDETVSTTPGEAPRSEEGRMQGLIDRLLRSPLYRQVIPQEAAVGWPIPLRRWGRAYVVLPFYAYTPRQGFTELRPPLATITLDWQAEAVVEFADVRFRNPFGELPTGEVIGRVLHPGVTDLPVAEYARRRSELLALTGDLLDRLAAGSAIEAGLKQAYGDRLRELIEPAMVPYYRALAPQFFAQFLPPEAFP